MFYGASKNKNGREISDYEDPKKLFHCVSPAHEDQHPSMSYNPHKNNYLSSKSTSKKAYFKPKKSQFT